MGRSRIFFTNNSVGRLLQLEQYRVGTFSSALKQTIQSGKGRNQRRLEQLVAQTLEPLTGSQRAANTDEAATSTHSLSATTSSLQCSNSSPPTKKLKSDATEESTTVDEDLFWEHPAELFSDEISIFHRCGMGSRVGPKEVLGFHGFFRQHWKDFWVTEVALDEEDPSRFRVLPREYNFSIPPFPTPDGAQDSSDEYDTEKGSFFTVDVKKRVSQLSASPTAESKEEEPNEPSKTFLQCVLHKQHMEHGKAMSYIAQVLRIHPRAISVAGMKDYVGDTVQRVRIENVSPFSALNANQAFKSKGYPLTLSHFSYESCPLRAGELFGNHFKIVLRGVEAPKATLQDAIRSFAEKGFPNYYGCQRFTWFGGVDDTAFALLMHNPLVLAFRFLNYTEKSRSLRELLQRPLKYPNPVQDEYRRNVVRGLRRISINPSDLDEAPFLSCPLLSSEFSGELDHQNVKKKLIMNVLWESYLKLDCSSRRPIAQRLSSYLWNQALTLRLHHFQGDQVLEGDHCIPLDLRRWAPSGIDRHVLYAKQLIATKESLSSLSIEDVVHPGFSFENIALPHNAVGEFYLQICQKYHLEWSACHSRSGLRDFLEPPRPIVRRPIDLKYCHQPELQQLTLEFVLERGCYANVAVTELMKMDRCAGSDRLMTSPLKDSFWDTLGTPDPGYVQSLQDVYEGYEDGLGFVKDTEDVESSPDSEDSIYKHTGLFFKPSHEDPYKKALKWGKEHLLRNMKRQEIAVAKEKQQLFEKPLARSVSDEELSTYASHFVPLGPANSANLVKKALSKRRQRYPGAPKVKAHFERQVAAQHKPMTKSIKSPDFYKLNRNAWNVTW